MCAYSSFLGSFLLLGVLKYQTHNSLNIEKSITTLQQIYKKSSPSLVVKNGNSETTFLNALSIKDINNALKVVTNDSIQLNKVIPKLFNVNDTNPVYVFSLPQETKYNFLTMHRDGFNDPIFPNLTTSYVQLMRNKEKISEYLNSNNRNHLNDNDILDESINSNLVKEDESTLALNLQTERSFIDFLNNVNKKDNEASNDWSLLGLHGWQGSLSRNSDEKLSYLKDKPHLKKEAYWDLPGKMEVLANSLLNGMKNNKFMQMVENLPSRSKYPITNQHALHSDSDVYIGRVNDPFGHSTKWNEKNSSSHTVMADRKKRGVIELYSMIKCSTGCDPIIFKGYGCYCGFLGDGYPVDGIDRCCKVHDKCYEYSNCIPYLEYFVPYLWKCYRGKPLCAIDHGEWGGPHSCAARLCQCDLHLSRCLRRFVCPHRRGICRTSKTRMLQNILLNF
ncbi:uncharacterized protein LOC129938791 [Eupeodes corollae]|uniref:uncharacterized protein LOC129938791 n=1 Tax=Eupeodes corollae TaxID=290404 RepID=UPI002490945A|nr:uncharacterized protein LOC129938791 [Eupeodes corollae]